MIIKIDTEKKEVEITDDTSKSHTRKEILDQLGYLNIDNLSSYDVFYSYNS